LAVIPLFPSCNVKKLSNRQHSPAIPGKSVVSCFFTRLFHHPGWLETLI
jgi:hypothetical protein